jgi:hypothetical protein
VERHARVAPILRLVVWGLREHVAPSSIENLSKRCKNKKKGGFIIYSLLGMV